MRRMCKEGCEKMDHIGNVGNDIVRLCRNVAATIPFRFISSVEKIAESTCTVDWSLLEEEQKRIFHISDAHNLLLCGVVTNIANQVKVSQSLADVFSI